MTQDVEFEQARPRLTAIATRLLGSAADADDAVQEAWLRAARSDLTDVVSVPAWLTTIVSRICLDILRARQRHPAEPGDLSTVLDSSAGPEDQAIHGDSVSLALSVVVQQLSPAERVAFVLHDLFAVPFEEIAQLAGRTPAAARQLASRAPQACARGRHHRET